VSSPFQDWVSALSLPHCGEKPASADGLVPESLQSFAFIPLSDEKQVYGVLILATEDPDRFKADMGSLYLQRIGDLVSAAVAAHL
jgi:hypothetical protein